MNVEYINPFIEAVYELFSSMLKCEVKRGDVEILRELAPNRDIVSLIGFTGPVRGLVALSFPVNTALSMVGRMLSTELRVVDDTAKDGIAELVNIVASYAKSNLLTGEGVPFELGLPTVVRGNGFMVDHPSTLVWLEIPFTSELGSFFLRVSFEKQASSKDGNDS